MAAKAFVLIETAIGKSKEVFTILNELGEINSVDTVTGPYDLIVVLEGETLNDIGIMVTDKIHPIPGIVRTVTCLTI